MVVLFQQVAKLGQEAFPHFSVDVFEGRFGIFFRQDIFDGLEAGCPELAELFGMCVGAFDIAGCHVEAEVDHKMMQIFAGEAFFVFKRNRWRAAGFGQQVPFGFHLALAIGFLLPFCSLIEWDKIKHIPIKFSGNVIALLAVGALAAFAPSLVGRFNFAPAVFALKSNGHD